MVDLGQRTALSRAAFFHHTSEAVDLSVRFGVNPSMLAPACMHIRQFCVKVNQSHLQLCMKTHT